MIKLINVGCINATAEEVWSVLADLESVPFWVESIKSARCDDGIRTGVGTRRVCDLSGGIEIKEHWMAWDEGTSFEYDATGMPLIREARNR